MRPLILCLLLAVSLSLIYNRRSLPLGNDEAGYQYMAQGGDVGGIWPPLYPLVGSLFLKLGFTSLFPVSLISLALLTVLLFKVCSDMRLGSYPVFLVALCPVVFSYGWNGMSDMLFTLLVTLTIWLFIRSHNWRQSALSGVLAILAYETRYIGEFLIGWMLIMFILERKPRQLLACGVASIGILTSTAINLLRYGRIAGERIPSDRSVLENLRHLGLSPWTVWLGDGPVLSHQWIILSLFGLMAIGWIVWLNRDYGLAILCYLGLLLTVESTIALEPISRRYLLPVVPLMIVLGSSKIKNRKAVLAVAVILALVHALRGRVA